jgi:hypothetical protein
MSFDLTRKVIARFGRGGGALLLSVVLVAGTGTRPDGSLGGGSEAAEAGPHLQEACGPDSQEWIRTGNETLRNLFEGRDSIAPDEIRRRTDSLVTDVVALHAMSARIFGRGDWEDLSRHRKQEFTRALTRYLRRELITCIEETCERVPQLRPAQGEPNATNGEVAVEYWLVRGDMTEPLTFHLASDLDGSCGIVDILRLEESLLKQVRGEVNGLMEEYSFPYMIAEIGGYDHVVLEDFERSPVGSLPVGWGWKDKDDDSHKPYRVRQADGNKYLKATDEGESVILGREIKWNLDEYPIISFRVRVNEIPPGADERYDDRVDSAAGIYFTLDKTVFGLIPKSVKYVWSSTLPVGSATIRDGIGRPWQVVFGSGRDGLGEWHTYYFDLEQAYRDTFGGDPPSKPLGIGILSDANSMNARAYADYDDIRALRSAPPGTTVTSGVEEILESG